MEALHQLLVEQVKKAKEDATAAAAARTEWEQLLKDAKDQKEKADKLFRDATAAKEAAVKPIEDLHKQIQKERDDGQKKIDELQTTIKGYDEKIRQAEVLKRESELKVADADKRVADADKRVADAKEVVVAAGQAAAEANKAEKKARAEEAKAKAETDKYEKLTAGLKSQQEALLGFAEDAKHKQDHDAAMRRARWERIFDGIQSLDPCKAATPLLPVMPCITCTGPETPAPHATGPAGKTNWDGTTPKADTSVAAETESGKGETRIEAAPSAAGARSTGMSERSHAALE
jgi:hypothetical protein